jgi:hypothetical protein
LHSPAADCTRCHWTPHPPHCLTRCSAVQPADQMSWCRSTLSATDPQNAAQYAADSFSHTCMRMPNTCQTQAEGFNLTVAALPPCCCSCSATVPATPAVVPAAAACHAVRCCRRGTSSCCRAARAAAAAKWLLVWLLWRLLRLASCPAPSAALGTRDGTCRWHDSSTLGDFLLRWAGRSSQHCT